MVSQADKLDAFAHQITDLQTALAAHKSEQQQQATQQQQRFEQQQLQYQQQQSRLDQLFDALTALRTPSSGDNGTVSDPAELPAPVSSPVRQPLQPPAPTLVPPAHPASHRDAPHWSSVYPSPHDASPHVTPTNLPFDYAVYPCVDGKQQLYLGFPVVACAQELDYISPYQLGHFAHRGVPRFCPPALTDRRNHLAHTRLSQESQPKAFELQFLGSAVSWQHATVRGFRALLEQRNSISSDTLFAQLELCADAFELNLANQIGRLKYLSLAGDEQLCDPTLRAGIITQVGNRQRTSLHNPLLTAPVDVDRVAFDVSVELAAEHTKQLTKLQVREAVAKQRE
jgi:hypothetical protein